MRTRDYFKKVLTNTYTLRKITEVSVDDEFGTTEETYTDYLITGNILPITLEDMRFTLPGTFNVGDARGYFYTSYLIGIEILSIDVNDVLIDSSIQYKVENISDYKWNDIEYREVYLRRIQI